MKKTGNTKAMEDALQAAVSRMGNGQPPAQPMASGLDPMSLILTFLPKLLESNDTAGEEIAEKLESFQKDEIAPIREQLAAQDKTLERILVAQRVLLRELRAIHPVLSALSGVVANLTEQMARIEVVDSNQQDAMYPDLDSGDEVNYGAKSPNTGGRARPVRRR